MEKIMHNIFHSCIDVFENSFSGISKQSTDGRLAFCLLCDFEGIKRKEFSKLLKISPSAASQNIIRAKERLETHPAFREKIEQALANYSLD